MDDLKRRSLVASRWSTFSSIATKIASPITTMILARILIPEDFGVLAIIMMIFSFADMLTDIGFQKYLIQHEFKDKKELYQNADIAFWSNLFVSLCFWLVIIFLRDTIAAIVGNPGYSTIIAVSCSQLILTSFSSIQIAIYRRSLNFATLFAIQIIVIALPFFITIPLALLGFRYWSLIIGSMATQLTNAVAMTIKSKWKPRFFYSFTILREMLSFSLWSLVEAVAVWLTSWVDLFIIGVVYNQYFLGLYRTSITMVNSLMALITTATIPVFYSTLSRLQNDDMRFGRVIQKVQKMVSVFIFPIGAGLFLYSKVASGILFGSRWIEASGIIGIYSLTTAVATVFCNYPNEAYRAKGKPKLSFLSQLLYLIAFIPACIFGARYGFWTFVTVRSVIQLEFIVVHLIMMKHAVNMSIISTFKNIAPSAIATGIISLLGYMFEKVSNNESWGLLSIFLCMVFYFAFLQAFPSIRKDLWYIAKLLVANRSKQINESSNIL